jgi:hypothetical protein
VEITYHTVTSWGRFCNATGRHWQHASERNPNMLLLLGSNCNTIANTVFSCNRRVHPTDLNRLLELDGSHSAETYRQWICLPGVACGKRAERTEHCDYRNLGMKHQNIYTCRAVHFGKKMVASSNVLRMPWGRTCEGPCPSSDPSEESESKPRQPWRCKGGKHIFSMAASWHLCFLLQYRL